jgi:hypothetical protein
MFNKVGVNQMFQYPDNVVRIMRPQVEKLKLVVLHHFKNRHKSVGHKEGVSNWIKEYRRVVKNSGYDIALSQMKSK